MKVLREKLSHPTSESLRKLLAQLFSALEAAESREEQARQLRLFLTTFEATARTYECWQNASAADLEQSAEALETLVTTEKYKSDPRSVLFQPYPHDAARDAALLAAFYRYSAFTQPQHLCLEAEFATGAWLEQTCATLRHISACRSSLEKLECVLRCHSAVLAQVRRAEGDICSSEVRLFAFVVLKSRTEQLFRSYYFLKKFSYKRLLQNESRLALKTLKRAIHLVAEMTPEKLSLQPGEDAPGEEPERKSVGVQTSEAPGASVWSVAHLQSHPAALQALLCDFCALRQQYRGK